VLAFALGGVALVGVPPSGAYAAKELLLAAASTTGQWWWAAIIQTGGIFTSAYLLLVLVHAVLPAAEPVKVRVRIPRMQEAAALALALCSLLLGLVPWDGFLTIPAGGMPSPLSVETLFKAAWPILAGGVVAVLLGRWPPMQWRLFSGSGLGAIVGSAQRAALVLGELFERIDGTLRQWTAAGISLLVVTIMFGVVMLVGR
jgi:NADH:ubiquinone oxidoreductase subunit 5 (subunit L)/multisubunit Na+/H+ antiporter MnhA subunit